MITKIKDNGNLVMCHFYRILFSVYEKRILLRLQKQLGKLKSKCSGISYAHKPRRYVKQDNMSRREDDGNGSFHVCSGGGVSRRIL